MRRKNESQKCSQETRISQCIRDKRNFINVVSIPLPKNLFWSSSHIMHEPKSRFLGMEIQPITAMLHLAPYNAFKVHFMTWRYHIQVLYKLY